MPAPTAVQKQIDKANTIHTEVYGMEAFEKSSDPSDIDIINSLPGADPTERVKPAEKSADKSKGGDKSPAAPVEAAGTKDGKVELEEDKFEQRYKVLQGKYNKEVPALSTQVKDLQSELGSMRNLLSSLEQIRPIDEQPGTRLLKDEDIDDYGQDMIDVIKRAAREEFTPVMNRLELENEQLRNALSGVSESVSVNARDTLYRMLNHEIPDWKEINQDSGFLEWLEGIDLYSGARKGQMLTQAFENNDAARVVAFFKGYLSENVLVSDTLTPIAAPIEPKVDLMSMAAPGAPRGGSTPNARTDKRVYAQKDVAQFYRNVQKGMYKGRDDEKNAIERDILLAGREGRLR